MCLSSLKPKEPCSIHLMDPRTGLCASYKRKRVRHSLEIRLVLWSIQGVSGGKVNILGGGSMDYSE
jgi:hypothetical protein